MAATLITAQESVQRAKGGHFVARGIIGCAQIRGQEMQTCEARLARGTRYRMRVEGQRYLILGAGTDK